jgi:hypothetical protein
MVRPVPLRRPELSSMRDLDGPLIPSGAVLSDLPALSPLSFFDTLPAQ